MGLCSIVTNSLMQVLDNTLPFILRWYARIVVVSVQVFGLVKTCTSYVARDCTL